MEIGQTVPLKNTLFGWNIYLNNFIRYQFSILSVLRSIYRILYQKNYNNTQAAQIIEAELEATPERDEILQFIKDSKRGIMKGYFQN